MTQATQVASETLDQLATAQMESNDIVVARKAKGAIKIAMDRITSALAAHDEFMAGGEIRKDLLASDLDNAAKYCESLRQSLKALRSTVSIRNRVKPTDPKQPELPLTNGNTAVDPLPV